MQIQSAKKVQQDIFSKLILHNDYLLAPEKIATSYDMLPVCSKKIADEYGIKVGDAKKLIPNLGHKTSVVLVFRN